MARSYLVVVGEFNLASEYSGAKQNSSPATLLPIFSFVIRIAAFKLLVFPDGIQIK